MDKVVFVDTSFFKALVDNKDEFHCQAVKIWAKLQKREVVLITSNYVIDEAFTLIRFRCGLKKVSEFRNSLAEGSPNFKIVRVMIADESAAWNWFLKDWSGLSFTDCVSFAVMKRLELKEVATFDQHFPKAGFNMAKQV